MLACWQLCKSTRKVSMRGYFLTMYFGRMIHRRWWNEISLQNDIVPFSRTWKQIENEKGQSNGTTKMALERGIPNRSRGSLCSPQRALVPMFEVSRWWHEREVLRQMEGRTAIGYRKLFLQCLHPSSAPLFFTNDKVPLRSSSRIGNFEGTHLTYERRRTSHFGREPTH